MGYWGPKAGERTRSLRVSVGVAAVFVFAFVVVLFFFLFFLRFLPNQGADSHQAICRAGIDYFWTYSTHLVRLHLARLTCRSDRRAAGNGPSNRGLLGGGDAPGIRGNENENPARHQEPQPVGATLCCSAGRLDRQPFPRLDVYKRQNYDWLILTSANGVEAMWERLIKLRRRKATLKHLRIAAIGPATKKAIEQRGSNVDVVPKEYVAESVVHSLWRRVNGKRCLLYTSRCV